MHSALVALEVAGKLNRISIDSRSIAKEYALTDAEPSIEELCRIAKHQGFRAAIKKERYNGIKVNQEGRSENSEDTVIIRLFITAFNNG